jgi:hypothetical protein
MFQPEISHRQWPSQASWAIVANNYSVQYKNKTIGLYSGFEFDITVASGGLESSPMAKTGPAVREHIYNNFARVSFELFD